MTASSKYEPWNGIDTKGGGSVILVGASDGRTVNHLDEHYTPIVGINYVLNVPLWNVDEVIIIS